jgi:hypothetical protein
VIAVFGQRVKMETTLEGALSAALGTTVGAPPSTGTSPSQPAGSLGSGPAGQIQALLAQATADYQAAQQALTAGGSGALGTYQSDINAENAALTQAEQLLSASGVAPTTKTTKPAKTSSKKTATTTTTTAVPA